MARTKSKVSGMAGEAVVTLSDITEHGRVIELVRSYGIPPLSYPDLRLIQPGGLALLATHFAIDVVAVRAKYYCFGELRMFYWMKAALPETTNISVRLHREVSSQAIVEHILCELLIRPVLLGVSSRELQRLARVWERLAELTLFSDLFVLTGSKAFARLLGLDPRRFRQE